MARETRTGGREATTGIIFGAYALSVGKPDKQLPEGWEWKLLTSIAKLESGHTPSRRHPEYWEGDIPWIGIRDATSNYGQTIYNTQQHTNYLGIDNSSARVLPAGTICLSRTASVGYVIVMGRPMATSQDFVNWVCTEKLNNHFLKYVLIAERASLNMFSIGTTHQTIYYPEVKAFHIAAPPRPEQDAIAALLGALDDKIDLNRRMNATLEAMARAIFKDWFVDFGPTRAKAEGRAPYLAPEIWDLFPDALDDAGVPVGWETSEIGKEVEAVGGATPSTKEPSFWNNGTHHWVTPKDLSKLSSPVLLYTDRMIADAGLKQISSGLLPVGTVLLSSRAPIGYLTIAEVPTAVNQGFIAMVCEKRLSNIFVLFWCYENLDYIKGISGGSTFAEISKKAFRPVPVTVPSAHVLTTYDNLVRPLYKRIVVNTKESVSLAQTRDLLLPKLMSGEIRLRGAEKAVEAVA